MAELNFNVLARPGPRSFYQGFEQGQEQRRAQENQLAEQQMKQQANMQAQQLNALKMQGYQEDRALKMQGYQEGRAAKTRAEKAALFRDSILRAPDPNTAREVIKRQYADPDLGPLLQQTIPLDAALSEISDDVEQFKQYQEREALGVEGYAKSRLPKVAGNAVYDPRTNSFITAPREPVPVAPVRQPPRVEEFNFARSPEGGSFTGTFQDYLNAVEAAKRPPAPAAATRAGGGGAGAGGAPAPKPMTALQQQAFRKGMAADKTGVKASQSVVNELEKLTDELVGNPEKKIAPHPGLSGITGVQAMLPSMPESLVTSGNSRKAQQRLETLKGKVMAFGRQLASLEGKLGNMAVQEWKFVSDSIQAIDPAAGNLDVQLRDIVRQAKNFANTVQERYDLTYEADGAPAESTAAPTATPPRAGGNAPGASNVAQERANANAAIAAGAPAAAVRQRFKQNTGQEL